MNARHKPASMPRPRDRGPCEPNQSAQRFVAAYRQHYDLVWRLAWKFGADNRHVDDLVQDTFLVVWRRFSEFEQCTGAHGAWLVATLQNVMRNHRRKEGRRERRHREFGELSARSHVDESTALQHLAQRRLNRFVKSLPPHLQDVFVLAVLGGYTNREIAAMLSINAGTVRSRLHVARAAFQAAVVGESRELVAAMLARDLPTPPAPEPKRRTHTLQTVALLGGFDLAPTGTGSAGLGFAPWLSKWGLAAGLAIPTGVAVASTLLLDDSRTNVSVVQPHRMTERSLGGTALEDQPAPIVVPPLGPIEIVLAPVPASASPPADIQGTDTDVEFARALAAARTALVEGRPDDAIRILQTRPTWPSTLAARAISLELGALCAVDRGNDAKVRLTAWRAAHPDIELDSRVNDLCW